MINAQNLLLQTAPQTDSAKSSQSDSPADLLHLKTATDESKKDGKDSQDALDPNAFLMLLSQEFASIAQNLPTETKTSITPGTENVAVSAETIQNALTGAVSDLTKTNPDGTVIDPTLQAVIDLNTMNAEGASPQLEQPLADGLAQTDNPALNWIDSQSFQSFATVTDQSNLAQTAVGQEDVLSTTAGQATVAQILAGQGAASNTATGVQSKDNILTTTMQTEASVAETIKSDSSQTPNAPKMDKLIADSPIDNSAADDASVGQFKESFAQSMKQASVAASEEAKKVMKPDLQGQTETATSNNANPVSNAQTPALANQPAHQQVSPTKILDIPVPVTNPQWGQQFSEQVAWLGSNTIKSAVIKIHPEELGPMEINVKVVKDSATVSILSHSAQVRDLVDQAIPKLREMMLEQGLNLSDVHVSSDKSSKQFSQNGNNNDNEQHQADSNEADEEVKLVSSVRKPPKRLVDYFA